jgi:hypothetical protein
MAAGLTAAGAGEVLDAHVEHEDGRFTVHADLVIAVPPAAATAVLTDYAGLPRVNDGVRRVILEPPRPGHTARMRVEAEVCILFLCLDYRWRQEVDRPAPGVIRATLDPTYGDFRAGTVTWRITPQGEDTRLTMDAELTPDFWFPPLIGPWLVKRKLREEALATALGVERVASAP